MNREKWLSECISALRPVFREAGQPVPRKVRASCSWPSKSALAKHRKRIGEAWCSKQSADGSFEVFISPLLDDPIEVAAVLVHELVHCAVGIDQKHGKRFGALARAVGLKGRMTDTTASDELKATLKGITKGIGKYPHAQLDYSNAPKTQTTRMKKLECADCGYTVRTTQKWLEVGLPVCPCGTTLNPPDLEEPEGE